MRGVRLSASYQLDKSILTEEQMRWLSQLPGAQREERAEILRRLRAAEPQECGALHFTGLAFAGLGSPADAVVMFEQASAVGTARPVDVVNSAVALIDLGELDLALDRLGRVAEGTDAINGVARRYIAEIRRAQQELEREMRLIELRAAALEEKIESGGPVSRDRVQLARLLISLADGGRAGYDWETPRRLLETARADAPGDAEALELLVLVSMKRDAEDTHELLRELERIAPDSRVLQVFDRYTQHAAGGAHRRSMEARISLLSQTVEEGGPGAEAALESLRSIVRQHPANRTYRNALMWASAMRSDVSGALTQAEWLARQPDLGHAGHFNIAQIFWFAGDRERGEQHFAQAYQLAGDDQERQDVIDRLIDLRGRDG